MKQKKKLISDKNLIIECFSKENLQHFVEVDAALWTNEEEIVNYILNANDNENEQVDDETEKIVYKAPSTSKAYYSIDQVRTFVLLNDDINTPEISMTSKNIANYVKKSYYSNYRQHALTYFFKKIVNIILYT